jgi:hypothetical protein
MQLVGGCSPTYTRLYASHMRTMQLLTLTLLRLVLLAVL